MKRDPLSLRFVRATLADLPFIERLRRRDSAALGFLSRRALEQKILAGCVRLAVLKDHSGSFGNSDEADLSPSGSFGTADTTRADGRSPAGVPLGFVLHGSLRGPEVRIFQLAVDPDYRNRGIARRLLTDLVRRCRQGGKQGLSLRCRETLVANRFWFNAGFVLHDLESARRGALFVWVRPLRRLQNEATEMPGFRFHSRWHACRGCGRMTCGSWSAGGVRRGTCGDCVRDE